MEDAKKIILLEDDRSSARLVSTFLETKGYDVRESHEGRFAIEMALKEKPDLMIVDVMLPDMHGSEAVKQICKTEANHDMKVLFLTSLLSKKTGPDEEARLTVAGKEYPAISKPFQPALLEQVVSRLLSGDN